MHNYIKCQQKQKNKVKKEEGHFHSKWQILISVQSDLDKEKQCQA